MLGADRDGPAVGRPGVRHRRGTAAGASGRYRHERFVVCGRQGVESLGRPATQVRHPRPPVDRPFAVRSGADQASAPGHRDLGRHSYHDPLAAPGGELVPAREHGDHAGHPWRGPACVG
jgi:hypothetical protein